MTETDTPGTTERGKPGLIGVPVGHKSTSAGVFFQRLRMDRNGERRAAYAWNRPRAGEDKSDLYD